MAIATKTNKNMEKTNNQITNCLSCKKLGCRKLQCYIDNYNELSRLAKGHCVPVSKLGKIEKINKKEYEDVKKLWMYHNQIIDIDIVIKKLRKIKKDSINKQKRLEKKYKLKEAIIPLQGKVGAKVVALVECKKRNKK